jgi:hypothetical protein
VNTLTAILVDVNDRRAGLLQDSLETRGVTCHKVTEPSQLTDVAHSNGACVLFLDVDSLPYSVSDEILEAFVRVAPAAPIVLLSEMPAWKLITAAIRERIWVDIPKSSEYTDLLQRYTSARAVSPAIVIDGDPELYRSLHATLAPTATVSDTPLVASSVGDALEMAINGRAPVFLELTRHLPLNIETSTLIYKLSPIIIAILVQMNGLSHPMQKAFYLGPSPSRFGVLGPSYGEADVGALMTALGVNWPDVIPKPVPKPSA